MKVKDRLSEITNIEFYYNAYEIIINKKFIDYEKESLVSLILSKLSRDENKKELNNLIINNSLENANKRQINFFNSSKMIDIRFDDNYIPNMQTLADTLLNIDSSVIDLNSHNTDLNQYQLNEIDALFH